MLRAGGPQARGGGVDHQLEALLVTVQHQPFLLVCTEQKVILMFL